MNKDAKFSMGGKPSKGKHIKSRGEVAVRLEAEQPVSVQKPDRTTKQCNI
jgi:hypothetical protein